MAVREVFTRFIILILLCKECTSYNLEAISEGQIQLITTFLFKRCLNKDSILKSVFAARFKRCPVKVGIYLECFPIVPNNSTYYHRCPATHFEGKHKIPVKCTNGKWEGIDYSGCEKLSEKYRRFKQLETLHQLGNMTEWEVLRIKSFYQHYENVLKIAFLGRVIDTAICSFSFLLLLWLIPIDNKRTMLHRNLIGCLVLLDILDLVYRIWLNDQNELPWLSNENEDYKSSTEPKNHKACSIVYAIRLYLFLAQICWMFNEAFFQFRQFYFVFIEKSYMWAYFLIGWVFPAVVVFGIFVPLTIAYPHSENACWASHVTSRWNYIVYITAFVLMIVNLVIIGYIMGIIWSKLRESGINELHKARQAARSFLILIILLGGGYVFLIYTPEKCITFEYMKAFIIPCQGTLICIAHVFMSREVLEAALIKLKRINTNIEIKRRRRTYTESGNENSSFVTDSGQSLKRRFKRYSSKTLEGSTPKNPTTSTTTWTEKPRLDSICEEKAIGSSCYSVKVDVRTNADHKTLSIVENNEEMVEKKNAADTVVCLDETDAQKGCSENGSPSLEKDTLSESVNSSDNGSSPSLDKDNGVDIGCVNKGLSKDDDCFNECIVSGNAEVKCNEGQAQDDDVVEVKEEVKMKYIYCEPNENCDLKEDAWFNGGADSEFYDERSNEQLEKGFLRIRSSFKKIKDSGGWKLGKVDDSGKTKNAFLDTGTDDRVFDDHNFEDNWNHDELEKQIENGVEKQVEIYEDNWNHIEEICICGLEEEVRYETIDDLKIYEDASTSRSFDLLAASEKKAAKNFERCAAVFKGVMD